MPWDNELNDYVNFGGRDLSYRGAPGSDWRNPKMPEKLGIGERPRDYGGIDWRTQDEYDQDYLSDFLASMIRPSTEWASVPTGGRHGGYGGSVTGLVNRQRFQPTELEKVQLSNELSRLMGLQQSRADQKRYGEEAADIENKVALFRAGKGPNPLGQNATSFAGGWKDPTGYVSPELIQQIDPTTGQANWMEQRITSGNRPSSFDPASGYYDWSNQETPPTERRHAWTGKTTLSNPLAGNSLPVNFLSGEGLELITRNRDGSQRFLSPEEWYKANLAAEQQGVDIGPIPSQIFNPDQSALILEHLIRRAQEMDEAVGNKKGGEGGKKKLNLKAAGIEPTSVFVGENFQNMDKRSQADLWRRIEEGDLSDVDPKMLQFLVSKKIISQADMDNARPLPALSREGQRLDVHEWGRPTPYTPKLQTVTTKAPSRTTPSGGVRESVPTMPPETTGAPSPLYRQGGGMPRYFDPIEMLIRLLMEGGGATYSGRYEPPINPTRPR